MIKIKRAYDEVGTHDGLRILVDHLWPRGLKKEALNVEWMKSVSPSDELRRWYQHDPAKWNEFKRRYSKELENNPQAVSRLIEAARKGTITLVFAARDRERNNAVVLQQYLQKKIATKGIPAARVLEQKKRQKKAVMA